MEIPTSKAVKSPFVTYGLAIVAQIVALIARLSLTPFLGDKVPYATFFLATAASASFGGWGPGIVSTALGALFASLFIIPPFGSLLFSDHSDYLGLIIFLMVSGIISRLAGSLSKTEARERELQQLFKQTLFSIGDAVVSTDADKRVLLMNPVAENMTGWTQSEAQGKEIHEVFPIVREGADNSAEDPITRGPESGSGVGVSSHAELITRQGRRIPIEESWAPVRREDGSPSGVVFVFRDISERRRAEKTLDSALQKTGSILESITDAFASLDSQWRITFVNREAKRLNGLASDEMVGKSCWDLFPEAIGKRVQEECLKAQEERVSREFTTFLEKSQRWFDFKVYPVSDGGASIFYRDVTGHRHSEMTLRDSEERMRLLIDSAHGNAIIGLSDKGRIINWNVGAERLLHYTAAEILGQHAEVMFTPEDREKKAPEEELLTARTKGLARSERWHMRKDGTRFWGSGAVTPWLDDKGLLKGFVKVFQDRTQEWFAEQSVHASEKRFRAAIQANIALLWTNNSAGEMEGEQAGWGAFTGQTQDEYQGYGWAKAVHPDDAQPTIDGWHKAVAERNTFQFEHRVRRHDGEWRLFSIRAVPVLDAAGAIREWVGVHTDITEQRQLMNALQDSESRFRTLANNISQFAWTADPSGWIFWYNERWYEYTGTTLKDMEGWGWKKVHHPDHVDRVEKHFRFCIEHGEDWEDTFPLKGKHGEWRWFLSRAQPIFDDDGRVIRWFGTNTDITDERRREDDLRRANQDLEQFAFSASHDLKEPLRNIIIFSQLLKEQYGSTVDPTADEFMSYVVDGAKRMDFLISDLLTYTQVTSLDDQPVTTVNSKTVLEMVLRDLQVFIKESTASITLGTLPIVSIKEVHLRQLFQNLISNAIKYKKEGHPPRVNISAVQEAHYWKFSVTDNGIGVPEEYQQHVFGLFKRLHAKNGTYSGTGIGLALCQKVVEFYGGRIWMQSQPLQGTTVNFTIPGPTGSLTN